MRDCENVGNDLRCRRIYGTSLVGNLVEKPAFFYIFPTAKIIGTYGHISKEAEGLRIRDSVANLDAIDWRILEKLQNDARQTYTALGQSLGLAHSTVYDRVKRMEQYGIIKRYTTVIDAEKAGTKNVTAIMTIFTDPKQSQEVAEKLSQAPQVLEVYTSLSEELLIIAKVVAEDQPSLHEFIASSIAPLPGVLRIRTSMITKKFKDTQFAIANDPLRSEIKKRIIQKKGRNKDE